MAEETPKPEIESLLADLQNKDRSRRLEAARRLGLLQSRRLDVFAALQASAEAENDDEVRQAALDALKSIRAPNKPKPAIRELTRNEKITHFASGFVGWFVVNGLIWFLLLGGKGTGPGGDGIILNACVLPANVILLVFLAFKRRWLAFGMLSAMALNLLIALILGVSTAGFCFIPFFTPLN